MHYMASSGFYGDDYKDQKELANLMAGKEVGLSTLDSLHLTASSVPRPRWGRT